jgi:hypothetical protein
MNKQPPTEEEVSTFLLTALRLHNSTPDPRVEIHSPLKTGATLVVQIFTTPAPSETLPDNLIPYAIENPIRN